MTSSTDPRPASAHPAAVLGSDWRARALAEQQDSLPAGDVVVSGPAPFGGGGLGRHLQEIVEALARLEQPHAYICEGSPMDALRARRAMPAAGALAALAAPLARFSPPWSMWRASVRFDAQAARRLPSAEHLLAFSGNALAQLRLASRLGYRSKGLVSPTSHMRRVARQYALAHGRYPLERPWSQRMLERSLAEYRAADRIYVSTRHVWESFVKEGVAEEALTQFPLTPDPRFGAAGPAPKGQTFELIYVGALSVAKGVPLLIDAVRRLAHADLRLILLGGWASRGMRRFVQQACAADPRITVSRGDPLPQLRGAHVCVHPSYEDGFAYAPAEALACGVPVIVSQDTGMKELVEAPRTGVIVPTGDLDALSTAIDAAYRGELFDG
jgi:glycosyltransferase involved in cell wall biosynthesis